MTSFYRNTHSDKLLATGNGPSEIVFGETGERFYRISRRIALQDFGRNAVDHAEMKPMFVVDIEVSIEDNENPQLESMRIQHMKELKQCRENGGNAVELMRKHAVEYKNALEKS